MNAAAAALGLVIEQPIELEEEFYLWPECVPAFNCWRRIQTQWVRDAEGRLLGLNYPGVKVVIGFYFSKRLHSEIFSALQAMEIAHINALAT